MRILFLGDIVGPPGVTFLKRILRPLIVREGIERRAGWGVPDPTRGLVGLAP